MPAYTCTSNIEYCKACSVLIFKGRCKQGCPP